MAPTIGKRGRAALDKWLDDTVTSGTVPATFIGVANKDEILYFNCKGDKVLGEADKGQVNEDTSELCRDILTPALQLWSMTKLVTCVACLQLKERGLVDYDDPELIERVLPELCAVQILLRYENDKPIYEKRTEPITLRRLLTHTVGQSYGDPRGLRWERENLPRKWMEANAGVESFATPLLAQPGSKFVYGLAIDWVGILIMRISGQTLEEYFNEHIWAPLGLKSFSFFPTPELKSRLMKMCTRTKEGKLIHTSKLRPVPEMKPEDIGIQAGGGGLLGTMKEYLIFLQHVLKCRDEAGIISPSSFRELFTDSLPPPDGSHDCQRALGAFLKMRGYPEEQYTSGRSVGYSTGLCLNLAASENGRKAGSGFWFGAARSEYWIDPATGIVVSRIRWAVLTSRVCVLRNS